MHSAVRHLPSVHAGLGVQIILKLTVDVINDRLPAGAEHTGDSGHAFGSHTHPITSSNLILNHAVIIISGTLPKWFSPVAVVHSVSKSRSVHYREKKLDAPFLHQHFGLLHLRLTDQLNDHFYNKCSSKHTLFFLYTPFT